MGGRTFEGPPDLGRHLRRERLRAAGGASWRCARPGPRTVVPRALLVLVGPLPAVHRGRGTRGPAPFGPVGDEILAVLGDLPGTPPGDVAPLLGLRGQRRPLGPACRPGTGLGPPPRPVGLRLAPVRGTPRCCPSEPPGRPGLLPPLRRSGTRPDRSSSRGRREPGVADRDPVSTPIARAGPGRSVGRRSPRPLRGAPALRAVPTRDRAVRARGLRPVPGRPAPGCPPLLGPFGPPRSVPARDRFEVGVSAAREDPLGRPGRPLAVPRVDPAPSRGAPPGRPLAPYRPGVPDRPVRLGGLDYPPVGCGAAADHGGSDCGPPVECRRASPGTRPELAGSAPRPFNRRRCRRSPGHRPPRHRSRRLGR